MGLTNKSTGSSLIEADKGISKSNDSERIIALGGNPNVGKSTIFNALTGMNQHTGNWPGKTVGNAYGKCIYKDTEFIMADIPGTYSLMAHSEEERIARDFICFGDPDASVIVVDATCLERNLNLVLQTIEITDNVIVCVNLLDEARRKGISIDLIKLSLILGVPVAGTAASTGEGINTLLESMYSLSNHLIPSHGLKVHYSETVENAISIVEPVISDIISNSNSNKSLNARWVALKLLENDEGLLDTASEYLSIDLKGNNTLNTAINTAITLLRDNGISDEGFKDIVVATIVKKAESIAGKVTTVNESNYSRKDRKIDNLLTSKKFGIPIMILLLGVVFWITITGANYPSQLLSDLLFSFEEPLSSFFSFIGLPAFIVGLIVEGMYRTLAWVVSVMLPPMAIFFPLFTLLEDLGYLPRVAFNLDNFFRKSKACGKQALSMCMGFGCNAAGVVGCRIIDSPRERLIAIITNNFVPCNGRFPTLIAVITMFFAGVFVGPAQSIISTIILTGVIVLGVIMTLLISRILSNTILKGIPSSFTLELPPYRKPQFLRILVRSILDRTLFVLGRAIVVAAPAGIVIFLLANITAGDATLLTHCADFLNPFATLIGMDGYILLAFILGFPANEIVVPIIIMSYTAKGSLMDMDNFMQLRQLLVDNGWTWLTALNVMLFSLMHWPCSTTCLTIKSETKSLKWTAISFIVPTITGIAICFIVTTVTRLLGLV